MTLVMVVDDDQDLAEMLGIVLTSAGIDVDLVSRGDEVLEVFRANPPDLVLLDVMLPGLNGIEVCRLIRAESMVPIVMLSAKGDTYTSATVAAICGVCHDTTLDTNHKNGNDNRQMVIPSSYLFGSGTPTYNGNPATTTNKTCSNVSCHFQASPQWQDIATQGVL